RPENAFILFRRKCVEDRNAVLGSATDADAPAPAPAPKRQRQADLSKAISAQWKALSAEEKQYWEDLAKERKEAHAKRYPDYVYRP
ncbi:high mobility group box domain-containing protein, partial [Vararia minispora EC-137]